METTKNNLLTSAVIVDILPSDSLLTRFKKKCFNFSEHLWSIPGSAVYKHNYQMIYQTSPELRKIYHIFAWVVLGIATFCAPPLGLLAIALSLLPKLIHRTVEVDIHGLNYSAVKKAEGFVDCTYPTDPSESNICDWAYTNNHGLSMLFDGVGHNDPIIAQEKTIYHQMAQQFESFVSRFDFNQDDAVNHFSDGADALIQSLNHQMQQHHQKVYEPLVSEGTKSLRTLQQNIIQYNTISSDQTLALVGMIKKSKVDDLITNLSNNSQKGGTDQLLLESLQALQKLFSEKTQPNIKVFMDKLSDIIKSNDPQLKNEFWGCIHHKHASLHRAGPAFGVAQFFKDKNNQTYLYTKNIADIGFLIITPKEGQTEVDFSRLNSDLQCEWIPENIDEMEGLGTVNPWPGTVREVTEGTLVVGFSDGIGEFLSRDEIIQVLRQWKNDDHSSLMDLFKTQIATHPKNDFNDKHDSTRVKACSKATNRNQSGRDDCKKFDPSGGDSGAVDDISVTVMVAAL